MNKIFLILIVLLSISCSMIKKQTEPTVPIWYKVQEEGYVISCAEAESYEEYLAKLTAKNIAFQTYPIKIEKYLNNYVADNCITSGNNAIQAELDKVFKHFTNYLMNIADVQIELGEVYTIPIKGSHVKCYVQLKIEQKFLHQEFVEFLETSDLYVNLKLRNILTKCFKN
ncbi:MAG: hypothetical protein P9M11_10330 [Candidatus Tenebribacter burtonii]|jgi:hypothetical protein|nr:hypothetical protein [Candidatus Tenebribacter burtonii]